MAYDKDGKWINPRSVGRYKCSDAYLTQQLKDTPEDVRIGLLTTIRTKEKLSIEDERLRWFFLKSIVKRGYKRRWGHYYQSQVWWKSGLDGFVYNVQDVTKQQLGWYDETQRILDLWKIIEDQKFDTTEDYTVRKALKKYFLWVGDLESLALFKYKFGLSFITGRKANRFEPEDIPYQFAFKAERFIYTCGYDFNTTYQTMFHYYANQYDKWLRGEYVTNNPGVFKPSAAKAIFLYAHLWRHFLARNLGECDRYDRYEYENEELSVDAVLPMQSVFPVLDTCAEYYGKIEGVANRVRRKSLKADDYEVQEILKSVYDTRFILPSAKESSKRNHIKNRHVKWTRK